MYFHTSSSLKHLNASILRPLQAPLSVIQGGQSFNSGRPVAKNSFLYTFDEPGMYCVASQGAPGFAGTVTVIDNCKLGGFSGKMM